MFFCQMIFYATIKILVKHYGFKGNGESMFFVAESCIKKKRGEQVPDVMTQETKCNRSEKREVLRLIDN